MTEQLTSNEKAYDIGQKDAADGHSVMINYSDWVAFGFEGSHSAYKAGYEDYINDSDIED